ncbi:MAG: hypothetical protein H6867_01405 [Rhodospirillales bacterium]|nr:hypothetical protein [Rhodospirillales bacterium]MCB9997173.1 hypothetical protein [Rhodospirillales bacterium]
MNFFSRFWQTLKSFLNPAGWTGRFGALLQRGKKTALPEPKEAVPEPPVKQHGPSVVRQYEEHPSEAYMELKYRFRDIGRMGAIAETMGRDFLTAMPEGAWRARLGQIAFLHRRMHEDLTRLDIKHLLDRAKTHAENHSEDWDAWDKANLREMEEMHNRQSPVEGELVEKRARLSYEGRRRHRDALAASDWPAAREFLAEMVDMNRQIAEAKCRAGGGNSYYQALMSEYMPGISVTEVEDWFGTLDKKIGKMLPQILKKQAQQKELVSLKDFYPAKAQMWLNHALLESLGFDFHRGGLYETGHNPVEGGTPDDTRLVIKNVDINDFTDSMKSALHEGGHGLYIQGLPRKTWRYQPVAQDMGAAVHESQALLVEMIMGRTRSFYDFLAPRVEGLFHGLHNPALSAENLYGLKTKVQPGLLRKKADEVTYFFHMKHRFELERDLIEGKLKPSALPEAWNGKMNDILGIQPEGVADGCLQDVHWFVGKFGYFPAYTVGHMYAAQLYEKICKDIPDTGKLIAAGDFLPITNWLGEKVHAQGRLYGFTDLVKNSTGSELSPAPLLKHLETRYCA